MMARRLISVILTAILVLPSLYSPTFSMEAGTRSNTSTSPDPFGWGTNKVSFISVCTSGCTGTWPHVYTITHYDQTSGAFSGTGVGLNDSATEVIRGTITPSGNLTLHSIYTKWSYSYDVTATRAGDGTFSGTLISSQNQRSTVTLSPPKGSTGNGTTPIPQPSPSEPEATQAPCSNAHACTTVTIPGNANIFGAGHASLPTAGGGGGSPPPTVTFSAHADQVLTFTSVTGQVKCTTTSQASGPEGSCEPSPNRATDINSVGGIAGIVDSQSTMFLVGVFLDDSEPHDPAPPRLDFSSNTLGHEFTKLAPVLNQVFYIGDGKTSTGKTQQFAVPAKATRLVLGFADAFAFHGDEGWYGDDSGSLTAMLSVNGSPPLQQPGSGTWTVTGKMTAARINNDLTLLPNGKALAVSSWGPGESPINTAELYDPHTGMWASTGKTIIDSYGSAVVLLSDGKVLVAGGESIATNRTLSTAELYDPRTNTWTATGSMLTTHSAQGILLRNGLVLVAGGCNTWIKDVGCTSLTGSSELYDPRTGTWTATGSMVTPRFGNPLTLLPDGKVLATGGCGRVASTGPCATIVASAEVYDPHTGRWSRTGSMDTPRYGHTATLLPNGNALIIGGCNSSQYVYGCSQSLATAELYDSHTGAWTATSSMTTPRASHTATLLSTGQVLVAGGYTACCYNSAPANTSAELYDPSTGTWTATASLHNGRYAHGAVLLGDGRVLVAGGGTSGGNGAILDSAELYSASTSGSLPALGPVDWWKADGDAKDAVGSNDGNLSHVTFTKGVTRQAFSFDGKDSSINFGPHAGNFGTGDFTIQFWARVHGKNTDLGTRPGCVSGPTGDFGSNCPRGYGILGKRPICNVGAFWDIRGDADGLSIEIGDATPFVSTNHPLDDGPFHLVTFVRRGVVLRAYTDAHLDATTTASRVTNVGNNADLVAGRSTCTGPEPQGDYTGWLNGQLDDIKLYTRALSDQEIADDAGGASNGQPGGGPVGPTPPSPPSPPVPVGHCPQKETIGGWSFRWASCPHDERVVDVVVVPPHNVASGFQLDRPYLIVHSLAVTARDQLVRPVLLPNVAAAVAGFSLTARVLEVDTTDVTIRTGTLFLPAALQGLACYPVPIDDVRIEPDTGSSPRVIRLTQPLQFTYAGARFDVDGLALTRDGLAASSARMALPGTFGGRGGFAVEHLLIGSDGSVGGTVRLDTDVAIGSFSLHIGTIRIDGDGLTFTNASGTISLPTTAGSLFAFHIDDFTFDGTTITKGHLNAQVSLPMLQFGPGGGWTLHPNANNSGLQLTVSVVDGVFMYTLTGDASLDLPFIHPPTAQGGEQTDHYASIDAHLEIGSITWDRPLNLYTFGIKIFLPRPMTIGGGHVGPEGELPLGDTDLALTSLGGQVEITGGHNNVIYTVGVNAGIQDLAMGGLMLDSRINGTVTNDGNFGVSGAATLFLVAHLKGGICVQVTLSNDRVCRDNLGSDASRATGYGTYASLGGAIDVPSTQGGTKHLTLTGNVFGHLWTGLQPSTVQPTPTSTATPPTGGNGRPLPKPNPTPTPSPPSGHLDYHFYGDAKFRAKIDAGYFASVHQIDFLGAQTPEINLFPPCPVDAAATGALGTFHYQQNPVPVSGIKAGVTGQMMCRRPHKIDIAFRAHIFYEPPTQVAIGDQVIADYQSEQGQTSELTRGLGGDAPSHRPSRSVVGMAPTGVIGSRSHGTGGALPPLVRSVTIAPGETSTFFTMGWAAGSPTLRVIAPNGTVYRTPRNRRAFLTPVGSGAYWFQSSDPHLLTSSSRAAQALYLVHPQPGIWRVVASGLRARARVHLVVIGDHAAPVVRVTVPGAGQQVPVRPSAPRVPLAGTVQGGSPTGTVGLFYTTNPTVVLHGQTVANLAGTLIVDNIPVRHGRWHYSWDTRHDVLRRGRYYIYAQLNDGIGPVAVGYGRGIIQVVQQNRPDAPRRVRVTVARTGRSVVLHWLSPTNNGTVFGYVVRWRRDGVHAPRWTTLHVGRVLAFQFPPLVPRAHYVVEVASYDLSGAQSRVTTARFVAPVARQPRGVRRSQSRPRPHVALGQAYPDGLRPRIVLPSLARNHAHHLALRVVGPTCSINDLAGTPYANAVWREPGPGGGGPEIVVGRLDAVLARSTNVRVNQSLYGNLDYVYAGDPVDVMLTVKRLPTGKIASKDEGKDGGVIGYNKYYNLSIERIGRATGMVAVLTAASVKPKPLPGNSNRDTLFFDPPGWESRNTDLTDSRNYGKALNRGHLRGDVFYGSYTDARNFVTEYERPNKGAQGKLEATIARDLRDGVWSKVYYRVIPHYNPHPVTPRQYVIPTSIEIEAIEVKLRSRSTAVDHSNCIHVDIPNQGDMTSQNVWTLPCGAREP